MHYIGLALYAEGPTDYAFLRPLLQRVCEDICLRDAQQPVDLGEVLGLNHPVHVNNEPRERRVLEAAKEHVGAWRILFVHTDGAGDPSAARQSLVQPALNALHAELDRQGTGVSVVPVRETEAWAICDGDALRQVFGTIMNDRQLGIPSPPRLAETTPDPKATLMRAFLNTNPTSKRRRRGVTPLLNALGESVALSQLRLLSSFRALEAEVLEALRELNVVR